MFLADLRDWGRGLDPAQSVHSEDNSLTLLLSAWLMVKHNSSGDAFNKFTQRRALDTLLDLVFNVTDPGSYLSLR